MSAGSIVVDLLLRTGSFSTDTARSAKDLEKLKKEALATGRAFGDSLKSIAAAAGLTVGVAAFAGMVRSAVDGIDALNDLSDATGASIENLSALEDAAARTGTQLGTVGDAIVKLNQQLANTDPKSGAAQALKAIGLDAEALRRIDPAEALLQVATALQSYADDGNKARLVQELFGKSVREVAPLLKDLAESGRLNATVTREQAEEASKFNRELAQLSKLSSDAAREIAGPLVGAINTLLERVRKDGVFASLFTPTETGRAIDQANDLARSITVVTDRLLRAETLAQNLELPGAVRQKWASDAAALRTQLEGLQRQALAVTDSLKGSPPDEYGNEGRRGAFRPTLPTLAPIAGPARVDRPIARPDTFDDEVTRSLASLIAQTDTVKLAEITAQFQKLEQVAAAGLDPKIVEDLQRMLTPVDRGDVGPPMSAELEKINALLAQTDSAQLAEAQRTLALLNEELSRTDVGSARFVQLQEAIMGVQDEMTDLAGTFPELKKASRDIGDELGLAFTSAFEDAVVKAESLKSVLTGLAQDMARILTRRLVTEPLADAATSWAKSINWGNLAASIFGGTPSANGNAFDGAGRVTAFASGGVVTGATPFTYGGGRRGVMGEAGAEGILPLKRGSDGKLGVIAHEGGGGGVVVNQTLTFNVQGQVDMRTRTQVAAEMGRAVQLAVRRNN